MHTDPLRHIGHFAEVITHWSRESADALAFRFLSDGSDGASTMSYGELDRSARAIAATMRSHADAGQRALLIFAPGLDFIEAFVACLYAGITAVPVFPPSPGQLEATLPRFLAIAADAEPQLVLTTKHIEGLLAPLLSSTPMTWIATDRVQEALDEHSIIEELPLDLRAPAPALLQYTSGSTGDPKGVIVSHGNLLANERAIRQAFGHDQSTVGVSWLPTYHDMGLMGKVLQTLYLGGSTTLISPLAFIKRPRRWLEAISTFDGTTSGGPNFAYELCTRRITDEDMVGLDLSSWRVAFCGAEPIRMRALDDFARKFAACGFRREALFPCYGLAESTLIVSGGWLDRSATPISIRAEALERGQVEAAAPDTIGSAVVVSCGGVIEGHQLRVVDPERHTIVEAGVGELWVAGPSVAQGYWRNVQATQETFGACLSSAEGPFLRTGDLGFVREGQVYVTGRRKELLVVHGRNIYPQDVEASIVRCHPQLRVGGVAVFAIEVEGCEQAAAVVELRKAKLDERASTRAEIESAVRMAAATHGLSLARLALVEARTLPKTSSGKLQRTLVRQRLLAGAYDQQQPELGLPQGADNYDAPNDYFEKLEARNTNYRFDIEADVAWTQTREPGLYFNERVLAPSGIDLAAMANIDGLADTFQWALAIAICEEFVALERRIISFLREERSAGRLPCSRSAALFDTEEAKHVQLFRRYADELKAQRPADAAELDAHLQASFETAWWHGDTLDRYPSPAVYHFVNWLHFVYFEEYSIYLHGAIARDPGVQPAWLSAHAAHMREERQHVVTDAAHLERLRLDPEQRREWSRWFLDHSARDASGLAGLEGVWTFVQGRFSALAAIPQPGALLANMNLRKRAFLRLLTRANGFGQTLAAATGLDDFVRELDASISADTDTDTDADLARAELELQTQLKGLLASALNMDVAKVDVDQPLLYFGLDSVKAVEIAAELEDLTGVELPPTLLFEHPNVRALARAIAGLAAGETRPEPVVESLSLSLDESMFELDDALAPPRQLLLTGATGFLCGHLLAELMSRGRDRVSCLVRATDEAAGLQRLRENLEAYGVWRERFAERIDVVLGDLSKPLLGLTPADFTKLAADTDEIFHGGAMVDFIQPYERLEAVNVGGTHEIIRLAVRGKMIPLNLISTIGIFDTRGQDGRGVVREGDGPDESEGFRNGYGRSKWAAEQLVAQARERGLPVRVFRPGIVSGNTHTGAWQPDMVAALLKCFVESQTAILPAADGALDAAAVDYVSRAILHIAAQPDTLGGVFHLNNPDPTPWREVYEGIEAIGYPLRLAPYADWLGSMTSTSTSTTLVPYLAYFKTRDQAWKLRQPTFDCSTTLRTLEGSGIECPRFDVALLGLYLDYFRRTGFLEAEPQTPSPGYSATSKQEQHRVR